MSLASSTSAERQLPVIPTHIAVFAIMGNLGIGAAAIAVTAAFMLLPGSALPALHDPRYLFNVAMTANLMGYPASVLWTLWIVTRHASLADLGFRRPGSKDVKTAVVAIAGLLIATTLAEQFVHLFIKGPLQPDLLGKDPTAGTIIAVLLLATILAPFSEELIFRVLIFNAARRWQSAGWAAITSGLIFAVWHFEPNALLPLAVAGIILGLVYAQTRNAFVSMICHASLNTVAVATMLLDLRGHG